MANIIRGVCVYKNYVNTEGKLVQRKVMHYDLAPARHGQLVNRLTKEELKLLTTTNEIEEGFFGATLNHIYDRREAKILAIVHGQYKPFNEAHAKSPFCFSEDLW